MRACATEQGRALYPYPRVERVQRSCQFPYAPLHIKNPGTSNRHSGTGYSRGTTRIRRDRPRHMPANRLFSGSLICGYPFSPLSFMLNAHLRGGLLTETSYTFLNMQTSNRFAACDRFSRPAPECSLLSPALLTRLSAGDRVFLSDSLEQSLLHCLLKKKTNRPLCGFIAFCALFVIMLLTINHFF